MNAAKSGYVLRISNPGEDPAIAVSRAAGIAANRAHAAIAGVATTVFLVRAGGAVRLAGRVPVRRLDAGNVGARRGRGRASLIERFADVEGALGAAHGSTCSTVGHRA